MPPSIEEWLPERHMARFVVEVVEQLDLSAFTRDYRGRGGSVAYHPATLLALLIYGYATGVNSSRKIERATYDSVAFRYLAGNEHPDHDTLATFRRRFLREIEGLFVQVLKVAGEMGVLKLGTVALDGTKIHANASRHSAMSYAHAEKVEARLRTEVRELLELAEKADQAEIPDGMSIPEELAIREKRLTGIAEAKAKIEARAQERFEREQAIHAAQIAAREEKSQRTGKKPGGRDPEPPTPGPRPTDQINFTDEDSRIMPIAGGGFEQAYNAQAAVDTASMLVVSTGVTQAPNDKGQVEGMLAGLADLPSELGEVETMLADTGYFSEKNVLACQKADIEPLIAVGREPHHPPCLERFAEPPPLPEGAAMPWPRSRRPCCGSNALPGGPATRRRSASCR